eukprot:CAMPEP_0206529914 /NCGR_PEP_ID=MMETSP0325_2-20121206/2863_1 /ASSEMBLY_ACC=CAM_ASM_000347 /TAXON_ID=2866 /ORGANISM="Crypthecodinium cohnii, Strain Seligo" /LENGTH=879 /DNA_ID=CAMNT_0054025877 /DNA_START=24 /DNA_END=2660 /DNA_ORIENTATION=-
MATRLAPTGMFANTRQNEVLTALINKHLQDDALLDFAKSDDFHITTTERGINRYVHEHLIAALDTLNTYQRNRKAQCSRISVAPTMNRQYRADPRTRLVELLKRWLRTNAANDALEEDDVRKVERLCRDLLNHGEVFPARNARSFVHTITDVYGHLQWQLREVLGRDRSCADLVDRALVLAKNLLSDALTFLLMGATDLRQTDSSLPSTEAVALWGALPPEMQHVLPARADEKLQKAMGPAWQTSAGGLVAALLCTPEAIRLFGGRAAREGKGVAPGGAKAIADIEVDSIGDLVHPRIDQARKDFSANRFKNSGFAGPFRKADKLRARESFLESVLAVFHLSYLLGGAFTQFRTVGDGMGDYGMIRMSPWLHPFLKVLEQKVMLLKSSLESLNLEVEEALVLAKSRGSKVEGPVPTQRMCSRAHEAIDRAIIGKENHSQALLVVLEKLRARSAPERLPKVIDSLNDACVQLQSALTSDEFRLHVGDAADDFPKLEPRHAGPDFLQAPPPRRPSCSSAETGSSEESSIPITYLGDGAAAKEHGSTSTAVLPLEDADPDATGSKTAPTPKQVAAIDDGHKQPAENSPVPSGSPTPSPTDEPTSAKNRFAGIRDRSPMRFGALSGALSGASPWRKRQGSISSGSVEEGVVSLARVTSATSSVSAHPVSRDATPQASSPTTTHQNPTTPGRVPTGGSRSTSSPLVEATPVVEMQVDLDGTADARSESHSARRPPTTPRDARAGGGSFGSQASPSPTEPASVQSGIRAQTGNPFSPEVSTPGSRSPASKVDRSPKSLGMQHQAGGDILSDHGSPKTGSGSPLPAVQRAALALPQERGRTEVLETEEKPTGRDRSGSCSGIMRAVVYRCTSDKTGFKRHDQRQIW